MAAAEARARGAQSRSLGPPGRAGGVYIPPHKLAAMQREANDDSQKQRFAWESLRKAINGLINKVNVANMANIVAELFRENLIRGRGLLCRAVLKAQMASPGFTHVYAALIAIINTKLPQIGELLLKRIILQFRRAYKRNNKVVAVALVKFIAHLVNQQVCHELLALQVITLLLERPTDDSVEVAISFVKECGQFLTDSTPTGMNAIFDRFRGILHEGDIDKRVQYMIEGLFAVRKAKFNEYPSILPELDLVESEDQITHDLALDDDTLDADEMLDVWSFDPDYEQNEGTWADIRRDILGDDEAPEDGVGDGGGEVLGDEHVTADMEENMAAVAPVPASNAPTTDMSETELVQLRRTIYLTIMNSLDFEECAHKLMKLNIPRGLESELANMLIECCSQERTYMRYYGLLGQRFCLISSVYQDAFEGAFATQYAQIHRLETNKLRNVAKFFAHLLCTDALPWTVFEYIRLNEEETTSSSRIFIKILLQELSEYMGLVQLRDRFLDESMQESYSGIFPKDDPKKTRFSINFFTSIGLGALTDDMRAHLKALASMPKPPVAPPLPQQTNKRRSASASSWGSSYSSGSASTGSSYSSDYSASSSYTGSSRSRSGSTASSYTRSSRRSRSVTPKKTATNRRASPSRSPRRSRPRDRAVKRGDDKAAQDKSERGGSRSIAAADAPAARAVPTTEEIDLMADERKRTSNGDVSPRAPSRRSPSPVDRRERVSVGKVESRGHRRSAQRSRSRRRYSPSSRSGSSRSPPRRRYSRSPPRRRYSRSPSYRRNRGSTRR